MTGLETEKDITEGSGEHGKWKLWNLELESAKLHREAWLKEVDEYYKIYEAETEAVSGLADDRYPIMWANIQTLKPLVYSNLPLADIRKRYTNKDVIARLSGILLEKGVNYFLETGDANKKLKKTRDDGLITGLGELKVRFEADFVKLGDNEGEEDDQEEEIADKRIEFDFFSYDDVLTGIAKDEDMIPWKAYRHRPTRDELVKMFGDKGKKVALNQTTLNEDKLEIDSDSEEVFKRAEVWEIWDRRNHKVIFWSNGYKEGLLSEEKDSYNLTSFYPSPPALNMGRVNNKILPVPPYRMYKSQAEELNRITERIEAIINQIRVGGLYNKVLDAEDAQSILMPDEDGVYKPTKSVDPNVDINKLIYNKDVKALADVLTVLRIHKQELIEEIRDITGISDIVRGTSNAVETATAQKLKGNFAISRMSTQQDEMSRFIRDLIRITGELLAENWSGEELAKIAGMTVIDEKEINDRIAKLVGERDLNSQELLQMQQVMQQELEKAIKIDNAVTNKQLEAVEALLTDDQLRNYAIDIESETTAQLDNDKQKAQRIEFLNIMTAYIKNNIPLVQAGVLPMDAFKAMVQFVAAPFKVGRELEEAFDMLGEQSEEQKAAAQQPSKEMIDAMNDKRKLDIEETKVKGNLQISAKKLELEEGKAIIEMNEKENDREADFTIKKLAEAAKMNSNAQGQLQ